MRIFTSQLAISVVLIAYGGGAIGLYLWQKRRKKLRPPHPFKLLREPGHFLRNEIEKKGEQVAFWILGGALLPILIASLVVKAVRQFAGAEAFWALPGAAIILIAGWSIGMIFILRDLDTLASYRLGLRGERAVAEAALPLLAEGYWIFHDVPAEAKGAHFNLDHVTVGATGVCAIETKTRQKGKARPGFAEHEVTFDGKRLIWPSGESTSELDQALRQARWLEGWIAERLGFQIKVLPILVIPGWYTNERIAGPVRITNEKRLQVYVEAQREGALTPQQVDQISRLLDSACRVEI